MTADPVLTRLRRAIDWDAMHHRQEIAEGFVMARVRMGLEERCMRHISGAMMPAIKVQGLKGWYPLPGDEGAFRRLTNVLDHDDVRWNLR